MRINDYNEEYNNYDEEYSDYDEDNYPKPVYKKKIKIGFIDGTEMVYTGVEYYTDLQDIIIIKTKTGKCINAVERNIKFIEYYD